MVLWRRYRRSTRSRLAIGRCITTIRVAPRGTTSSRRTSGAALVGTRCALTVSSCSPERKFPVGPAGLPFTTCQNRRRSRTGNPARIATASARNPSMLSPKNRTVGSGEEWPSPPWHESNVSTPPSCRTWTYGAMPGSRSTSCALYARVWPVSSIVVVPPPPPGVADGRRYPIRVGSSAVDRSAATSRHDRTAVPPSDARNAVLEASALNARARAFRDASRHVRPRRFVSRERRPGRLHAL